jgi:hypothetical protein
MHHKAWSQTPVSPAAAHPTHRCSLRSTLLSQVLRNLFIPPSQIAVAVMLDGTVAVEVASQHALLQWPFMSDISMIDAIVKVFQLPPALLDVQPNTTTELGTLQVVFTDVGAPHLNSDIHLCFSIWLDTVCWAPHCSLGRGCSSAGVSQAACSLVCSRC